MWEGVKGLFCGLCVKHLFALASDELRQTNLQYFSRTRPAYCATFRNGALGCSAEESSACVNALLTSRQQFIGRYVEQDKPCYLPSCAQICLPHIHAGKWQFENGEKFVRKICGQNFAETC